MTDTTTTPHPTCHFCRVNQGQQVRAEFLAAQSADRGATVTWVAICAPHAYGWNDGGDWVAPIFAIDRVEAELA